MVTPASSRRGAVFALLLILAVPARAAEPDPQRKAEASAHLRRGAELIDAENLPGALAEFEAAYRLVPSPAILHNFGIVYQGLGRKVAALDAFQRFLDEAPKAPPAAREHAQSAVQTLRGQVAQLLVACDVPGAIILLDGKKVGETPQDKPILLDPGPHELSVEKPGLLAQATHLQAIAGQLQMVPVRLEAPPPAPAAQLKETPPPEPRAWQRPAAWTLTVAAAVAGGTFATWMVIRHGRVQEYNDTKNHCGTLDKNEGGPQCQNLGRRARDANKWAVVSGVAAGALAAGAAVLFLTLPEDGPRVSLDASPSHVGLGLQGRF